MKFADVLGKLENTVNVVSDTSNKLKLVQEPHAQQRSKIVFTSVSLIHVNENEQNVMMITLFSIHLSFWLREVLKFLVTTVLSDHGINIFKGHRQSCFELPMTFSLILTSG